MAKGYLEEIHESIPGNETNSPTLATKKHYPRLINFTPNLNPTPLERDDELVNSDEPPAIFPELFDPTWSAEERLYPDAIGYHLSEMLGLPTTTAGNGVITDPDTVAIPAGAWRHVWTAPFGPAGASPKTFQAIAAYSDAENAYYKLKGCATDQLALELPQSGGGRIKRSGPALFMDDIADPAITPAYEADTIPPFLRSHIAFPTWLASTGVASDLGIAIANPVDPEHTAGGGSKYPDSMYKGDGLIVITISVPRELINQVDFAALQAGTGFAVRVRMTSTLVIASGYPYKLYVEGSNAQYTDAGPDALENRKRRGMQNAVVKLTRSGSASSTITLVNATASYV